MAIFGQLGYSALDLISDSPAWNSQQSSSEISPFGTNADSNAGTYYLDSETFWAPETSRFSQLYNAVHGTPTIPGGAVYDYINEKFFIFSSSTGSEKYYRSEILNWSFFSWNSIASSWDLSSSGTYSVTYTATGNTTTGAAPPTPAGADQALYLHRTVSDLRTEAEYISDGLAAINYDSPSLINQPPLAYRYSASGTYYFCGTRWRSSFHPTGAGYRKVWLRQRFRPIANLSAHPEITIPDSGDTLTELPPFEWAPSSGYGVPDFTKSYDDAVNIVQSDLATLSPPSSDGYCAIEAYKWSDLPGYTPPDDGSANGMPG